MTGLDRIFASCVVVLWMAIAVPMTAGIVLRCRQDSRPAPAVKPPPTRVPEVWVTPDQEPQPLTEEEFERLQEELRRRSPQQPAAQRPNC